jgi:tetratricopeptide (TPR) repeat protein
VKVFAIACVVAVCGVGVTARAVAAAAAPTTAPSTQPLKADAAAKLQEFLTRGDSALTEGKFADARSAFLAAAQIDDGNLHALQGAAIASLRLKDATQAKGLIEKALTKHPSAARSDRVLNYNLAAASLEAGQPLRGAQALHTYLDAATGVADPPALDLLWADVYAAEDAGSTSERAADDIDALTKFATTYQDKVDALRPGMRRWGASWRPAAQVEHDRGQLAKLEAEITPATRKLAEAEALVKQRQQALEGVKDRGHHVGAVGDHAKALRNAEEAYEKAKTHLDRVFAAAKAARPELPKIFDPLDLDQTTSPGANDEAPVTGGARGGRGKGKG